MTPSELRCYKQPNILLLNCVYYIFISRDTEVSIFIILVQYPQPSITY
jgi:hypothetical protein